MFRIDSDGHVANKFSEGNPSIGQEATVVSADWLNDTVQEELCQFVEAQGITLNKSDNTQFQQAMAVFAGQLTGVQMKSLTPLRWDGAKIYFDNNVDIMYRSGAGTYFTSVLQTTSPPSTGEISLSDGEVVVMRKDNSATSPDNLAYNANYASMVAGEWAIVAASSLSQSNMQDEIVLFWRHDEAPAYHYGVDQKILDVVPYGHHIYHESKFNLGSDRNLLREENGLFSQGMINGNMQVSQRGNFTTAITSASGLADGRFFLDRFRFYFYGSVLANSSFQRTTATITGHPELTKASKIIFNTSGSPITGAFQCLQAIEDYDQFKGKTVTVSFWLRSNMANKVAVYAYDGVSYFINNEINTGSGDEIWRHYTVTGSLSSVASYLSFGFGTWDGIVLTQYSIPAGSYIEITGMRLYVGSDELPALIRSFDDELSLCQRYCQGINDGEFTFNPGYSIYNINGVATATWRNSYFSFLAGGGISDTGAVGSTNISFKKPLQRKSVTTSDLYLFDFGVTTQGGDGANARVSATDSAGATTHNLNASGSAKYENMLQINQSGLVGVGQVTCMFSCTSEIF